MAESTATVSVDATDSTTAVGLAATTVATMDYSLAVLTVGTAAGVWVAAMDDATADRKAVLMARKMVALSV